MPFTPLHMGPGMLCKLLAGRHLSLVGFGTAQIVIDLEPLIRILRGDAVLHGPTHTYLGALAIAAVSAPLALAIYPWLARHGNVMLQRERLGWLTVPPTAARWPVVVGALVGTLSHVALDSIMHTDMQPLAPWRLHNGLLGMIGVDALNLACLVIGSISVLAYLLMRWLRRTGS